MYWADEIAARILERKKPLYRVHDYKTPSGRIHVGALRGVVIHDIVARALRTQGAEAEYVYGFDDFDPMDGFPIYLPEEFRQYMGMPLSNIPSPEPGFDSFGHYYAQEFITTFNKLGIYPRIIWMSELYKAGEMNEAIRIALDHAPVIRKIYKEISGGAKPDDWYPLNVVCPNCGKIGTTRVFEWDGQLVSFHCEPKMVTWAEGCGFTGQSSPFDGKAKLPWKPEWGAKWWLFGEDFETAGKDHMTKNGSFDVAAAICREVYKTEPPLGRDFPYEWLLIGGKKMSSSKGVGASAKEVGELLPPHLLTFLIARTRPSRHLDFEPGGTTMPLLYDEYDKAIAAYNSDKTSDLGRVIEYTRSENQIIPHYTMRFSKVAFLSQMPNVDIWLVAEQEKGSELSPEDRLELEERITYAKAWLEHFAPEEFRFELQKELPAVELTDSQRQFLQAIRDRVASTAFDGAQLHQEIHALKTELGLAPTEAFGLIYTIFLGKASGPQAGWFLAALDKDLVLERLERALA